MSRFRAAIVAIAIATAGSSAWATEGWYGRIDLGYSVEAELEQDYGYGDNSIELDDGPMGAIGFGYAYSNGFRAEGEFALRHNEYDIQRREETYIVAQSHEDSADVDVASLMINMYYDFNRGGGIEPYVGVGAGVAEIDVPGDEDSNWAWQGLAGLAFSMGERTDLDIGYRYFRMEEISLLGADGEYTHEAVTVGLRHQFSAPAAVEPQPEPQPQPQPQPAAVCPTSEFVVYFEWDRSNLNDAALQTIDAAVQRARECNTSAVLIVGHTDTSGSAAYNAGLSQRRAAVVADAMTSRGMAAGLITTEARGESDLARQTRDGVREPLNRRTAVTITFR